MTLDTKQFLRVLATAVLLSFPAQAQSGYTITTFAGAGGISGFAGDGGAATAAQLAGPICVAVDSSGNVYIADENNNRIRKVSSGTITTVAGNGTQGYSGDGQAATSAMLHTPNAVAVDGSGNIYISDTQNLVVRKVDTKGTITTIAGNNLAGGPGFTGDNGPAIQASLGFVSGLAVDGSGNIFIADPGNQRIRKVDSKGTITTVAGTGTVGSAGDGGPGTVARLNNPLGLAVDPAGNLYIADTGNNKIRKLATNGIITTVAGSTFGVAGFGGDGGAAVSSTTQLNAPQGVAVDSAGNIYIADQRNSRIRKVSTSGIITTIAGNGRFAFAGDGGPGTSAALNFPDDLAVDAAGNVYVADYQNQVIRMLTPSAGSGGSGVPAIGAGGVVSAAAFGGFSSIAPGSWIEIYGSNLASDTREWAGGDFSGSNAPTSLDRTSVTVEGQPAFVRYVSPGQVNVQVPSNVVPGQWPIVVTTAGGISAGYTITVNATQPGLLAPPSFLSNGKQYVVAQFPDGSYVLPTNAIPGVTSRPAKPGETIVIYGVGFGPVNGVSAGQIAPASSSVATQPQIFFGFTPAASPLPYAGLAGGFVGLYQFNVVVPNVTAGDAVPLSFTLLGANGTQTLFTAVQN
ncbi:MAG TPA: IPT/TIG domain-containing protein [Bryobacteraceae bacterium]